MARFLAAYTHTNDMNEPGPFLERGLLFLRQQVQLSSSMQQSISKVGGRSAIGVLTREGEPCRMFEDRAERITVVLDGSPQIGNRVLDARAIAGLYRAHGAESLARDLDGGWTCLIVDERTEEVLAIRDRIGLKPLYYANSRERTVISSSAGAIVRSGWVSPAMNVNSVARYAAHHYRSVYGIPHSFFEDVQLLGPSTILRLREEQCESKRYWDADRNVPFFELSEEELKHTYRERHLSMARAYIEAREGEHCAVALSGGIDSGTMCGLLHTVLGEKVDAISMTYGESTAFDESTLIKHSVRDHVRGWTNVQPSVEVLLKDLPALYHRFDIPLATISIYGYDYLYREAANHGMKNIFTGAGGDYIQAGNYTNFLYALASLKMSGSRRFERELDCWIKNHGTREFPKSRETAQAYFDRHVLFQDGGVLKPAAMPLLTGVLDEDFESKAGDIRLHVVPPYGELIRTYTMQELFFEAVPPGTEAEDVIDWSYGTSMISPFFSREMLEFGWQVPLEWKIDKGVNKVLAREALRGICSDEILNRIDKSGFNAPFDLWIRGPLKDIVMDILTSQRFRERGVYNQKKFKEALEEHMTGKANHMMFLWQAVNLELWLHSWVDQAGTQVAHEHS